MKTLSAAEYQVFVGVEHAPAACAQKLHDYGRRRPTGNVEVLMRPFGFSFRTEPHVFSFVAVGTSGGMGLLLLEFASHARYVSYVAFALSTFFFGVALVCARRFVRSLRQRVEVVAVGSTLEHRLCSGRRAVRTRAFPAEDIVAVAVMPPREGEKRRVVLLGPRHRVLCELYQSHLLDPDTTLPWFADMVGVVASYACGSLAPPSSHRPAAPDEP